MTKKSFSGGLNSLLEPKASLENEETADSVEKKKTPRINRPIKKPKWKELEKVNVLMSDDQKDFLDDMSRRIMRSRSKGNKEGRERITSNTILRVLIDLLKDERKAFDYQDIENESSLKKRVTSLLSKY